ncbi:MAG: hypothetical protein JXB18_07240 [Sedimentisphaerales bacterium]|nr:hypothetical protein [Sedimentisphaerales bacterium]
MKKPENGPENIIDGHAAIELGLDQVEAERPGLSARLPFGYRATSSPFERLTIMAIRLSRRCGKSAAWTAAKLNELGITRRGKPFTRRIIYGIIRQHPNLFGEGQDVSGDESALEFCLSQLVETKKNIENLSSCVLTTIE